MSKSADKAANRSAMKQNWNHMPTRLKVVAPAIRSWWTEGSAPNARETFIALAHERDRTAWSSVVPHAMNVRAG